MVYPNSQLDNPHRIQSLGHVTTGILTTQTSENFARQGNVNEIFGRQGRPYVTWIQRSGDLIFGSYAEFQKCLLFTHTLKMKIKFKKKVVHGWQFEGGFCKGRGMCGCKVASEISVEMVLLWVGSGQSGMVDFGVTLTLEQMFCSGHMV